MIRFDPRIHHRKSIRLKGFDYSREGLYFITICTHDRQLLFGRIEKGKMNLSDGGKVAHECWLAIPEHFPKVKLHEFVIMPDHLHGIIELTDDSGVQNFGSHPHPRKRHEFQKIIPRSVGSVVRGFKIGVTKYFRANTQIETAWQRNFHERIIRNEESYLRISRYITNNPLYWKGS
jgi:putative transposase